MIGGAEAADALAEVASRGGVCNMRLTATLGLGKLGDARAVEPLLGVVRNRRNTPEDRVSAIQSLAALGDARARAVLVAAVKDLDKEVSKAAAAGLKNLRATARAGGYSATDPPTAPLPVAGTKDDKKAMFYLSSGRSLLAAGNYGQARWYAANAIELPPQRAVTVASPFGSGYRRPMTRSV